MSVDDQKAVLRLTAKAQRKQARAAAEGDVADRLASFLVENAADMNISGDSVLAGYWAMADEIDVIPAMSALKDVCGLRCALPVVVENNAPLVFRSWQPGEALESGGFGTHHPYPDAEEVIPDVLLVPLLAFDMDGYRMGWGGGFYDRTLGRLRGSVNNITAIGVAYAGQKFDAVVRDRYDQPMNWIATEQWIHRISSNSTGVT